MKAKSKRLQFDFSPKLIKTLKYLKQETECTSAAEVVRRALRIFEFTAKKEKEGYEVVATKDGEKTILITTTL